MLASNHLLLLSRTQLLGLDDRDAKKGERERG